MVDNGGYILEMGSNHLLVASNSGSNFFSCVLRGLESLVLLFFSEYTNWSFY